MESAICYEDFLKNSGYKTKLQYQQPKKNNQNSGYKTKLQYQQPKKTNQNKKKRKHNIIWFNLPYRTSVKTNIGRISSI